MARAEGPIDPTGKEGSRPTFVELPTGIFTAAGTWFRVTTDDLADYASPLLDRMSIDALLAAAETVLRSPQTLGAWLLLGMLFAGSPAQAAFVALVIFTGWSVVGPGLVLPGLVPMLRVLEVVWLQGAAFVVGLSLLGMAGNVVAVGVGLAGFVLLRWGLVSRLVEPVVRRFRSRLYALPVEDQALRAVIIRFSLRERVSLPQIDAMESRMLEIGRRRSRGASSANDHD